MFEKILAALTALCASLDANTAALKSAKTPAKTKAETSSATPEGTTAGGSGPAPTYPSVQDIRDAAKELLAACNNDDKGLFTRINARLGVKKISETPEDKRAEVIAEIKAAMPKAAPAAAEQI